MVRESHEYRRVTFLPASDVEKRQFNADWSVQTDIIRPDPANPKPESGWDPFDPDNLSITHPFEYYALPNGLVDWEKPSHVCIELNHTGSHQQLWVLYNATGTLHNFHIHQMKFRLATKADLRAHGIQPSDRSHTCKDGVTCSEPDYELYDGRDQPPGSAVSPQFRERKGSYGCRIRDGDTLRSLRLIDRNDPAVTIVAKHFIELAKSGE